MEQTQRALSVHCDKLQVITSRYFTTSVRVHVFANMKGASFFLCYLQVSIDEVKDKDSSHTDEELCGGVEAAQVDSEDPQLLHRLYVG